VWLHLLRLGLGVVMVLLLRRVLGVLHVMVMHLGIAVRWVCKNGRSRQRRTMLL
jgi:hypothetical protein